MRAKDLTLATAFDTEARFWNIPENREALEEFRAALLSRGIAPATRVEGDRLVLSYRLSIADALAVGYNEVAPDELRFALEDACPELKAEPERVAQRIRELESVWGIRRRAG